MPLDIELCDFDELPDSEARGFDPFARGRDAVFVIRRGDDLKAYRNVCPHQGASLPWRKDAYLDVTGTEIVCNAHGARFDIDSGRCLRGPALGRSLDDVHLAVTGDRRVIVRLEDPEESDADDSA